MSPWYQDVPNGAFGNWITKKSKSVLGGSRSTVTSMISTGPIELIVTLPVALGKQPLAAPDGTTVKLVELASWTVEAEPKALPSAKAINTRTARDRHRFVTNASSLPDAGVRRGHHESHV